MSVCGKIIDLDQRHGYGLIETTESDNKVFFHIQDMASSVNEPHLNEVVEFDIESDWNGCQLALNISPAQMK